MGRPFKCPYCGASRNIGKGHRYNKNGAAKIRKCKVCARRWTVKQTKNTTPTPSATGTNEPVPEAAHETNSNILGRPVKENEEETD